MQLCFGIAPTITSLLLLVSGPAAAGADGPATEARDEAASLAEPAQRAVEPGLAFLQTDTTKWREERKCATCHQGTMTVWALSEARSRGYPVGENTFRELTKWTKERLENIDSASVNAQVVSRDHN